MKVCEYFFNQMYVNKTEDEYFADNMIIYIKKMLTEKSNYNQFSWVQKYDKNDRPSFRLCNFFDNYICTRLCIHFYWISQKILNI